MQLDNFITVGKVLNSFGLKGQVKVDVYLEDLSVLKTVDIFCIGDALIESKIHFLKKRTEDPEGSPLFFFVPA